MKKTILIATSICIIIGLTSCESDKPINTLNIIGEWELVSELCTYYRSTTYYDAQQDVYYDVYTLDTLINYKSNEENHIFYSINSDGTFICNRYSKSNLFEESGSWSLNNDTITCPPLECQIFHLTQNIMFWSGTRYYAPSLGFTNTMTTIEFKRIGD